MQESLKLPLQLTWKEGPLMPYRMSKNIQSVLIQGKLYVGGGWCGFVCDHSFHDQKFTIMEYDTVTGKWAKLAHTAKSSGFAMVAVDDKLVLVGGVKRHSGEPSKSLDVWSPCYEFEEYCGMDWVNLYPEMSTVRGYCSAVVYNQWLVVTGNVSLSSTKSSVEVLNTENKQWSAGKSPSVLVSRKPITIEDKAYFMGDLSSNVYSMSLPALISQLNSMDSGGSPVWTELPQLPLISSAPLSISGSLLAVGGVDKESNAVKTAIHLYLPDTGTWVKVGDLPSPRGQCTCAMIADKMLTVAGGVTDGFEYVQTVDIATLSW